MGKQDFSARKKALKTSRSHIQAFALHALSKPSDITAKAKEIAEDIRLRVTVKKVDTMSDIWSDFCQIIGINRPKPAPEKCFKPIKAMLIKAVNEASLNASCVTGRAKNTIGQKAEKHFKTHYGHSLFSRSKQTKYYARNCERLARCTGVASTALNDGLTPYFVTITLDSKYHIESKDWQGNTPTESARLLNKAYSDLTIKLRNNNVAFECIKALEPHRTGIPHLHLLLFTNEPQLCRQFINDIFADKHGLYNKSNTAALDFKKTRSVKACIRYMLQTFWGTLHYPSKEAQNTYIWSTNINARRFSITSTMRKYPPVKLWQEARQGRLALERYIAHSINISTDIRPAGETLIRAGEYSASNTDDLHHIINSSMTSSASRETQEGDFATFTDIFNEVTGTRKRPPVMSLRGAGVLASLDIIELRIISQEDTENIPPCIQNIRSSADRRAILNRRRKPNAKAQAFLAAFKQEQRKRQARIVPDFV